MGLFRRAFERLAETDEERLAEETRDWGSPTPSCRGIGPAPLRTRVTVAGVIRRITVLPMEDNEALEVLISDGTGEVVVQFMGRRSIAGLRSSVITDGSARTGTASFGPTPGRPPSRPPPVRPMRLAKPLGVRPRHLWPSPGRGAAGGAPRARWCPRVPTWRSTR